jgi:Holliday junction DNA helicase RuvA
MINYLQGKILRLGQAVLVLLVNDIGYRIFINSQLAANLAGQTEAGLWIYHQVKEDGQALYGFNSWEELELFELLIGVSGVGPKSAHNILASASVADLKAAIAGGDASPLTRVSGIGQKTAQRLIVDLKGKVDYLAPTGGASALTEELDALLTLGYGLAEAREALRQVDGQTSSTGERIRQALKYL